MLACFFKNKETFTKKSSAENKNQDSCSKISDKSCDKRQEASLNFNQTDRSEKDAEITTKSDDLSDPMNCLYA
jgi:hypothetical protein